MTAAIAHPSSTLTPTRKKMTSNPNGSPPHKLAIAADHGGVELKNAVVAHLQSAGYGVEDLGVNSHDSVDYPDYAEVVADKVLSGEADAGILVCTTGIGMCIAANRHVGVRPRWSAMLRPPPSRASTTTPTCCAFPAKTPLQPPRTRSWMHG